MMRKFTLITTSILSFSSLITANAVNPSGFEGFKTRIDPSTRVKHIEKEAESFSASNFAFDKRHACLSSEKNPFIGWNDENPAMPSFAPEKETSGEKMDSIVGHYIDGKLMSKQEFVYTSNGKPKLCRNYLPTPDGKGFQLDGYYSYEYDANNRVINAEKVSTSGSSMKMEYVYDGDCPVYSIQIAYLPDNQGEWTPYQKGEYSFDSNYNTTLELFSLWSEKDSDWVAVMKNEAEYDEESRLTAYFPYVWDNSTSSWAGNKSGAYEGQRFSYTQSGDDAQQIDYTWENNSWLEYKHTDYTYNDAALLTVREEQYWNREKQDWNGGDGYGEYGDKKYNSRDCFEYDEYGRVVLNNFYRMKKTETYVNNWRGVYSYADLGDGEIEKQSLEANIPSTGEFEPTDKKIERTNKFGSETYYAELKKLGNDWEIQSEEYRYHMPEYNWYLGYESFRYENGEKIATGKEEFLYSEDFNPAAGYQTPYEGRHYVLTSSGLTLRTQDKFVWGPRDVIIEYVSFDCLSGTPLRVYGWDVEYDFSADCSNIFMWPDANKGDVFYENKNISSNEYYNPQYVNGNDSWNNAISSHLDYYYSSREDADVTAVTDNISREEIGRFDILGNRMNSPQKGVNIIIFSDGSYKKIII